MTTATVPKVRMHRFAGDDASFYRVLPAPDTLPPDVTLAESYRGVAKDHARGVAGADPGRAGGPAVSAKTIAQTAGADAAEAKEERETLTEGKNPAKALVRAGKHLARSGKAMPGYGQIFVKENGSGEAWYVGGDGDERGFDRLVKEILSAVEGIDEVTYEAEAFPPDDEGWVQVYPEKDADITESAMAVSTSDFAGQQMLQVSGGKVKHSHLESEREDDPLGKFPSGDLTEENASTCALHKSTTSEDAAPLAVSAADNAVRILQAILDADEPFSASTLVDALEHLNPEECQRVLMQVGITAEELQAAMRGTSSPDVLILAESEVKDSLGRTQCYDDTSGKHIPCGGDVPPGKAGGGEKPAPFDAPGHSPTTAAMLSAFHSDERMATIDAEITSLAEKERTLHALIRNPRTDYTATVKAHSDKAAAVAKLRELKSAREQASQQAFLKHYSLASESRAPKPTGIAANPESKQAKDWEAAAAFLEQISHKDGPGKQTVNITATAGRASYAAGTIKAADTDDAGVMAHEYGHHLESTSPWVQARVAEFRAKRFRPEDDRPMADVVPGGGYGKDEIGNPDQMHNLFGNDNEAHYIGVTYAGGDTEIVSMLLEQLFRHPVRLAQRDAEAFRFIVGLLQDDRSGERQEKGTGGERKAPARSDHTPKVGQKLTVKEGERTNEVEVKAVGNGKVSIGYPDSPIASTTMPIESFKHFVNDLSGKVDVPPSKDADIEAVRTGKAKLLGKGDDGIAFRNGDSVVKVSSTVPNIPTNPGHRTPDEAADMLRQQTETSEAMREAGVPGMLPTRFVQHGDKGFQIRPYVEIPDKLTRSQLDEIRGMLDAMHNAGYTMNDEVQVGLLDGNPVFFDTGKAERNHENPGELRHRLQMDGIYLERLYRQNGEELKPKRMEVPKEEASRTSNELEIAMEQHPAYDRILDSDSAMDLSDIMSWVYSEAKYAATAEDKDILRRKLNMKMRNLATKAGGKQ